MLYIVIGGDLWIPSGDISLISFNVFSGDYWTPNGDKWSFSILDDCLDYQRDISHWN